VIGVINALPGSADPLVRGSIHAVKDNADAIFTWDYEKGARPALDKLYEKAKVSQWNGETDLPGTPRSTRSRCSDRKRGGTAPRLELRRLRRHRHALREVGRQGVAGARHRVQNWSLSQFMHGEQGALICTAKIVETVPWIDAKYYAATQVMDEARHVEVFAKYLDTKLNGHYPLNAHLGCCSTTSSTTAAGT
jgi:hypothetical protein